MRWHVWLAVAVLGGMAVFVLVVGELIAAMVCVPSVSHDPPPDHFGDPGPVLGRPLYMEDVPVHGSNKLVHPDKILIL